MDISYSLALEDHARINPLQGLEALAEKIVPTGRKMQVAPKKEEVQAQNQEAMSTLQGMLKGVQFPSRRGPRRAR